MKITLPHNFTLRPYQSPLWEAICGKMDENGALIEEPKYKRAFVLWHRRTGKDKTLINLLLYKAVQRVGVYYYFYPSYAQGRKALWENIDKDGFKFMNHIPDELVARRQDREMIITLINGSTIQIIGTDNVDSVMGTNPVGCVFSEFALHENVVWDFIRPILAENGGWAIFNTTPRGKNHAYKMFEMAKNSPDWFCEKLSVEDTGIMTEEDIQKERDEEMDEELIQSEYYCSFEAASDGAFFKEQVRNAREETRITELPILRDVKVDVYMDLGMRDATALIFVQRDGEFYNIINYFEDSGKPITYYCNRIKEYTSDKDLGTVYVPHDARVVELGTGIARLTTMRQHLPDVKVVEKTSFADGIDNARRIFSRCRFNLNSTTVLIDALSAYQKKYNKVLQEFGSEPVHNWASHAADAFRYFAVVNLHARHEEQEKIIRKRTMVRKRPLNPVAFMYK